MNTPAVLLTAALTFAAGWWLGQSSTDLGERVAALEARIDGIAAGGGAVARAAAPSPAAPPEVAKIDVAGAPSRGPKDAAITLVEFSDFECPYCLRAHPTVEKLRAEYPDDLRVVFKHFPLSFHKRAINAHRAVIAAGEQGKFWEMHDRIFESPRALSADDMKAHADRLGLDVAKFTESFDSERLGKLIDADVAQGRSVGVRGTPAFFVNGRMLSGAQPFERFKQLVDEELAKKEG